jgi:hypothetical protein
MLEELLRILYPVVEPQACRIMLLPRLMLPELPQWPMLPELHQ